MAGRAPIAVVVVNYNTCEHLRRCLETVCREAPEEVIVADNGSTDGSVEMVRSAFPDVQLLVDPANPGYGTAANRAIARCRAPYVLLLNSDTRLLPGTLAALHAFLQTHPTAGLVGPRLIGEDGLLQASCFPFPSPLVAIVEEGPISRWIGAVPWIRSFYLRTWDHRSERVVPWVMGAAMAIRREAFEAVGGFDERFFMYFEETDLCYRLRQAGWHVYFSPAATVAHVGGASTRPYRAAMTAQLYASMIWFYRKHYSAISLLALVGIIRSVMWLRLLRDRLRLRLSREPHLRTTTREAISVWQAVLGVIRAKPAGPNPARP